MAAIADLGTDRRTEALGAALPIAGAGWARQALPLGALLLLSVWLFFRHIGELGLVSDDWVHLSQAGMPMGVLLRTWPMDYRLFDEGPWVLLRDLGVQPSGGYYALLFGLVAAIAWMLQLLVARLTGSVLLGLAVGALWMVYPADPTPFWLTCYAYRFGLLFLLGGLLLLTGRRTPGPVARVGAVACCGLCLLSNELYVGLVPALPVLAAIRAGGGRWAGGAGEARERAARVGGGDWRVRLRAAGAHLVAIGGYALYRIWIGPRVLLLPDQKLGQYRLDPLNAIRLEAQGIEVLLRQAWRVAGGVVGPGMFAPYRATTADAWTMTIQGGFTPSDLNLGCQALLVLYIGAALLAKVQRDRRWRDPARWEAVRPGALLIGLGGLWLVGGYLALALTVNEPSLGGILARVNAAAIPGAAMCLAGCLWVVARSVPGRLWGGPRGDALGRSAFAALVLVPVVLGGIRVGRNRAIWAAEWGQQRQLWTGLLAAAPALQAGTFVLLTDGDKEGADTLAGQQVWGITLAIRALYGASGVDGSFVLRADYARACAGERTVDSGTYLGALLTGRGLLPKGEYIAVPYDRIVIFAYSGVSGRLGVVRGPLELRPGCALRSNTARIRRDDGVARAAWLGLTRG